MSKDAFYFKHDSNAKDDPKCVLLIEQLGMEGYGIFWILIETLRDQPDYKYPVALLPALARRYNTTLEKVKTVVWNYGLFVVQDDVTFFSQSLIIRMQPLEQQREQARIAGLKSAERRRLISERSTDVQQAFNDRSTIREEKSRIEKRKINNNSPIIPLPGDEFTFDDFWNMYEKKVGDREKIGRKWAGLSLEDRKKIFVHVPLYKEAQPDKQFRKDPATYLNQKAWNDEIIERPKPNGGAVSHPAAKYDNNKTFSQW
jgi:hypothetical protein